MFCAVGVDVLLGVGVFEGSKVGVFVGVGVFEGCKVGVLVGVGVFEGDKVRVLVGVGVFVCSAIDSTTSISPETSAVCSLVPSRWAMPTLTSVIWLVCSGIFPLNFTTIKVPVPLLASLGFS